MYLKNAKKQMKILKQCDVSKKLKSVSTVIWLFQQILIDITKAKHCNESKFKGNMPRIDKFI